MRSHDNAVIALAATLLTGKDLRALQAQVDFGSVSTGLAREVLSVVNEIDHDDFVGMVLADMAR